jgi:hypothetical protein
MKRLSLIAAISAAAACSDAQPVLAPILEVPAEGSEAYPYEGIEELELSVARSGDDAPIALATAPIGEPLALAEVPFGDDLVVHLSGRAGGIEIAYGRTCIIDVREDDLEPIEPHLYFSRIVKWGTTELAVPPVPDRVGGTGYALPGGGAAFAGGDDSTAIEVFDPLASGSFARLEAESLARNGSLLVPFENGKALIVGGTGVGGDAVPTAEVIDPSADNPTLQIAQHFGPSLVDHAAITLVDGSIIVTGGAAQEDPGDDFIVTNDAWQFRFGEGNVLEPPLKLFEKLAIERGAHTMTRLNDEVGADVLIVGGVDPAGALVDQAELYRPLREAFEIVADAVLTFPRHSHQAVRMPGGFVLVIGGLRSDGMTGEIPARELELYDPSQGVFLEAGTLPANAGLTDLTITRLADGRVLLTGGRDVTGDAVDTVLIARLDPINGQVDVIPTDGLAVPRAGHSAVPLCDGTIMVVGGTNDPQADAERYNPPSAGRR